MILWDQSTEGADFIWTLRLISTRFYKKGDNLYFCLHVILPVA